MKKLYKHHLYPRYMTKRGEAPPWGDPNAVVEVTYTQHIMFHWCNFQLWGNPEDKTAYLFMVNKTEQGQTEGARLGGIAVHKNRSPEDYRRVARKSHSTRIKKDPDYCSRIGKSARDKETPEVRSARGYMIPKEARARGRAKTNSRLYRCTITGYVSTAGPLTRYQKKRGIDPINREFHGNKE